MPEAQEPLDRSDRFVPPELSWLKLNHRYLVEAQNPDRPLLERVKLLGSLVSHIDEYLMEFLPQLRLRQAGIGADAPSHPQSDLHELIRAERDAAASEGETLLPELAQAGINVVAYDALSADQRNRLGPYFESEIFPLCTPLAHDPAHPFPFIADHTRNFMVVFDGPSGQHYGFLDVPLQLGRPVEVPEAGAGPGARPDTQTFVWLDDMLRAHLESFFPGENIQAAYYFRVLRQTLITTAEADQGDLLETVQRDLQANRFAPVAALFVPDSMPAQPKRVLMQNLQAGEDVTFVTKGLAGVRSIGDLAHLKRPDLKYPELAPRAPRDVVGRRNYFKAIGKRPILLNHPYDSFDTVVRFLRRAAGDPDVIAIRQTLYHVGDKSPVASALIRAARTGKQVTAVMEIRAHFDEETNIRWALAMKKAGVNVVYGAEDTKTHAKSILAVRREPKGVRRYDNIATGNYDVSTAEHECDLGMLTSDPDTTRDVLELFNHLTGRSQQPA